jgi:hypothetical protein
VQIYETGIFDRYIEKPDKTGLLYKYVRLMKFIA